MHRLVMRWARSWWLLVWLGVLAPGHPLLAQTTLSGLVVDSVQAPLPGAAVYLTRPGRAAGLAYGSTDAAGRFTLNQPAADTLVLHVRLLGYRPAALLLTAAGTAPLRVVLRPSRAVLGEVVVRAPPPPIRHNDTTTYQAKDFRTGGQRTLQDLLQRVPGFEVGDNGSIRYQGREISGIYVEGDNLTGADYRRLARTLDADLVEKIQPIQRFVENPLLGGLVHSETTALNITLPADRKKPLFGSLSAQAALPRYRDATLNAFSYQGRHKVFGLATHNNVGLTQDPAALAPLTTLADNPLRQELLPAPLILAPPPLVSTSFRPELATLNNETTAGVVHVLRSARPDRWKLLTDAAAYTDVRTQNLRGETRLLLPDSRTLTFREQNLAQQTRQWARLRQNWFGQLGPRTNFTYEHRLRLGSSRSRDQLTLATLSPSDTVVEELRQQRRAQPWHLGQNALLTTRFSEQAALQTQLAHFLDYVPQQLNLTTTQPARLSALAPGLATTPTELQQAVPGQQQGLLLLTEYFRTGHRLNVVPTLELHYAGTRLRPALYPATADPAEPLRTTRVLGAGRLRFHRLAGRATVAGAVGLRAGQLSARRGPDVLHRPILYPTADLTVRLAQGRYATWLFSYGYDQVLPQPQELLTTPLILDYRTYQQGLTPLLVRPAHRVSLQLIHLNTERLTQLQASLSGTYEQASIAQAQEAGLLTSRLQLLVGPPVRSATATLLAAHLLNSLATRLQLESSLMYAEPVLQDAERALQRSPLVSLRQRGQVGTAARGPLNLFAGATLLHTTLHPPSARTSRVTQLQLDARLQLRTRRLTASLRADQLVLRRTWYTVLSGEATYAPTPGSAWSYSLVLSNLFNARTFEQVHITPVAYSSARYQLLPRLIMPGATYRF